MWGHLGMPVTGVQILGMTPHLNQQKPAHVGDECVGAGAPSKLSLCQAAIACPRLLGSGGLTRSAEG